MELKEMTQVGDIWIDYLTKVILTGEALAIEDCCQAFYAGVRAVAIAFRNGGSADDILKSVKRQVERVKRMDALAKLPSRKFLVKSPCPVSHGVVEGLTWTPFEIEVVDLQGGEPEHFCPGKTFLVANVASMNRMGHVGFIPYITTEEALSGGMEGGEANQLAVCEHMGEFLSNDDPSTTD